MFGDFCSTKRWGLRFTPWTVRIYLPSTCHSIHLRKSGCVSQRLLELDSGLRAASKDLRCYTDISGVKCEGERQGCRPPISLAMELFEVLHKTSPEIKEGRLSWHLKNCKPLSFILFAHLTDGLKGVPRDRRLSQCHPANRQWSEGENLKNGWYKERKSPSYQWLRSTFQQEVSENGKGLDGLRS